MPTHHELEQIRLLDGVATSPNPEGRPGRYYDKLRVRRLFQDDSPDLSALLDLLEATPVQSQTVQIRLIQLLIEVEDLHRPGRERLVRILAGHQLGEIAQHHLADIFRGPQVVDILEAQPVLCSSARIEIWRALMEGRSGVDRHGEFEPRTAVEARLKALLLRRDNEASFDRD